MITACTFCYNEAGKIERSLNSIKDYVGEIIVFDLESTDGTGDIARKYTDKVVRVPYLLCGDMYKIELSRRARGDWLLWWYPDEVFSEKTVQAFEKLTQQETYSGYAFMRREYMDDVRVCYMNEKQVRIYFGSPENPNYQMRLIRNIPEIYYTEFVHAEVHCDTKGKFRPCGLPPEYYMEHWKTSQDQEFDNIRLYVWYKYLISKYGDTTVLEWKRYVDSYKDIVRQSEDKNASGERKISLAEEFWWDWRRYAGKERITTAEFQELIGMPYKDFLAIQKVDMNKKLYVGTKIKDKILDGELERV